MVELLLNPEDKRTKAQKCEVVQVSTKTFYQWMANPHFIKYMNSQIDMFTDSALGEVWNALTNKAKRGDSQAIKLFFDMKKLNPDFLAKHDLDQQRMELDRQRFELEKLRANKGDIDVDQINENILNVVNLLQNPVPNREIPE